jgi:hypothetical protein
MNGRAQAILFLDGGAACAAGLTVLLLREQFVRLHGFSSALELFLGAANVAYASYSGTLATRASLFARTPSRRAIDVLITANLAWVAVCSAVLVTTWRSATPWGLAHVAFEAVFVFTLASLERRVVRPQAG